MTVLLGQSDTGANSANSNVANTAFAQRLQALATGTVEKIWIRTGAVGSGLTAVHCAVYADNAGAISGATRLSEDNTSGVYTANAWNGYTLATPVAVTSGTFYWIEFLSIGGTFNYTDNATTGGTERDTSPNTTCPNPHATQSFSNSNVANVYGESLAVPQKFQPDADNDAASWASTPLWSKVNDASDATFITHTLA